MNLKKRLEELEKQRDVNKNNMIACDGAIAIVKELIAAEEEPKAVEEQKEGK